MMSKQQSKASIQRLITLERAQKLDLLIHLVSNLSQPLIICGPVGIGKTTLLDAMLEYKKDSWPTGLLQGRSSLSFENILEKFLQQLAPLRPEYAGQKLSDILESNNKQNQKLVLIVDDAGMLVPGLISALIEFSHAHSSLRLVFSLTHDELHIKNSSDRFIDECHIIEIPPISKKQCTVFLQNLSAQPGAVISFNGVTDRLVDNLYRQTHGIPGKIVTELPRLARYKPSRGLKWGAGSFVIFVIGCAITLFYFSKPDSQANKTQFATPLIKKKVVAVEIASPVTQSEKYEEIDREDGFLKKPENIKKETTPIEVVEEKSEDLPDKDEIVEDVEKEHLIAKDEAIEPVQAITEQIDVKTEVVEQEVAFIEKQAVVEIEPVQTIKEQNALKAEVVEQDVVITENQSVADKSIETVPVPKADEAVLDDAAWVARQEAGHYTMQLMVLSKRQSVDALLKKYQAHVDLLKFFQVKRKGQNKYVVIYGSYKSSIDAAKAKKSLPTALRKAWVRKFKVLQKQLNAT